jgi:hypothetical protein
MSERSRDVRGWSGEGGNMSRETNNAQQRPPRQALSPNACRQYRAIVERLPAATLCTLCSLVHRPLTRRVDTRE